VTGAVSHEPSQVILLDGTVAMNPVIARRYAAAQVFFYAPSGVRRALRTRVDREKRGHATASVADDPAEERDYLRWIESQAGEADLIVHVKSHGTYELGPVLIRL